jgi:membrane-associated phospholipid phosphatase
MQTNNYLSFYKAIILSLFAAIFIAGFSFSMGKNNLFLLLNKDFGVVGDVFFKYATYIGDGVVWAFFAIGILIYNRKKIPLTLVAIIVSTIITHYIKGHLCETVDRPLGAMPQLANIIHTIAGVKVHLAGSFPSGHSTQAFTMYLLCCILCNKNWVVWVGLLLALLVGYSRVYQAQHFPIDVAGGIIVAIVTAFISLWVQLQVEKKWFVPKN